MPWRCPHQTDSAARSSQSRGVCERLRACLGVRPSWDSPFVHYCVLMRQTIAACSWRCHHMAQERSLLGQDELVLLGKREIGPALGVFAQDGAVALVSCETVERNQREGNVVGAFMRHEIAC